ncbi:hypothetical protein PI124_g5092 [Phytophthora idaei]|nr:hypothetical protein PI124_g5092 [Phytophthora idaei]
MTLDATLSPIIPVISTSRTHKRHESYRDDTKRYHPASKTSAFGDPRNYHQTLFFSFSVRAGRRLGLHVWEELQSASIFCYTWLWRREWRIPLLSQRYSVGRGKVALASFFHWLALGRQGFARLGDRRHHGGRLAIDIDSISSCGGVQQAPLCCSSRQRSGFYFVLHRTAYAPDAVGSSREIGNAVKARHVSFGDTNTAKN